jgi:hypothetical protein
MWRGKKVAVIMPVMDERKTIRAAILGYFETGLVDDVIVVNSSAVHGISQEIAGTGAREVFEPRRGSGNAVLCGIDHCDADIMILSKPDGSFDPGDVRRLLAYSDEVPAVFGTRTSAESRCEGYAMSVSSRLSNWVLAKITQTLFRTMPLTDVGCSLRLLHREALMHIRPHLTARGPRFDQQLMLEVISHAIPFAEVPVHFRPAEPSASAGLSRALRRMFRILAVVMEYRLGLVPCSQLPWRPEPLDEWPQETPISLANLASALGSSVAPQPAEAAPAEEPAREAEASQQVQDVPSTHEEGVKKSWGQSARAARSAVQ